MQITTKTKIVEAPYKEIAAIGFWRMGADLDEIARILDLSVWEVEEIIALYCEKKGITSR